MRHFLIISVFILSLSAAACRDQSGFAIMPTADEAPALEVPAATVEATETAPLETIVEPEPTATLSPTPTAGSSATGEQPVDSGAPADTLFALVDERPIIQAGDGGPWSQPLHNAGAVFFHQGQFHMFRNGYPSLPGNTVIGYATSPDGINWTHDENNPVFRTEDVPYAPTMIMASSALVDREGTWVVYFLIWDDEQVPGAIGRATAPAPTGPWTPDPAPVLLPGRPGSWDAVQVTQPNVLTDEQGEGYLMFYTGVDKLDVERVGLARSPDGIQWQKFNDPATEAPLYAESDPILEPSADPDAWDWRGAARGRVVISPDGYLMFYRTPSRGSGFDYGLAASADGIHWAKYAGNPILQHDDIPGATGLYFPTFTFHEDTYYFYIESFSGTSRVHLLTHQGPLDVAQLTGRADATSVVGLAAADVANEGSAADIEVRFESALAAARLDEYRLMLASEGDAVAFDDEAAVALPAGRFLSIPTISRAVRLRLPADLEDVNGQAIVEGETYVAFILSVGAEVQTLAGPSDPFALENVATVRTLVAELPSATGGLAIDASGNLYAANIGRAPARVGTEIYRVSPSGVYELWVDGQGLRGASGNTFDAAGNLIQSSLSANVIHKIDPSGAVAEYAREGIRSPVGVAYDQDGSLFVANCGGDNIQRIAPNGESTVFASGPMFRCPNGITLDDAGNVYVANFRGGGVIKVSPEGEASEFANVPGGNNGHIYYLDSQLYVVSRGGHQIYTLALDGELNLVAGTGERGHDDGPALQATFSLPNDIVPGPDGRQLFLNEVLPTSGSASIPSRIRIIELRRPGQ